MPTEYRVVVDGFAPGDETHRTVGAAVRDAQQARGRNGERVRAVVERRDVSHWTRVYVVNGGQVPDA